MKPMLTLMLTLTLSGLGLAQPGGPNVQVQGRRGSVNLGITADGRAEVNATGQRGSVQMQAPPSGWQAPGAQAVAAPEDVIIERLPQGKTYIRTRSGSYTVDDATLQWLFHTRNR